MSERAYLTQAEAADHIRVSVRTLRRLTASGRVRAVHPSPGRTIYTRRELDAYMAHTEGRRAA